jgi:integrase
VVVNGKTGEREVPLNSTARSVLKELAEAAKAKGWEYLFTNPNTGTRYKHLKHSFTSALSDAKIEDFRFHDLRHYAEFRTMPSRTWQATRVARESRCSLLTAVSATRHSFRLL